MGNGHGSQVHDSVSMVTHQKTKDVRSRNFDMIRNIFSCSSPVETEDSVHVLKPKQSPSSFVRRQQHLTRRSWNEAGNSKDFRNTDLRMGMLILPRSSQWVFNSNSRDSVSSVSPITDSQQEDRKHSLTSSQQLRPCFRKTDSTPIPPHLLIPPAHAHARLATAPGSVRVLSSLVLPATPTVEGVSAVQCSSQPSVALKHPPHGDSESIVDDCSSQTAPTEMITKSKENRWFLNGVAERSPGGRHNQKGCWHVHSANL